MIGLEWVLGLLVALILGSYGFTWVTYLSDKKDRDAMWKEINRLRENEIKHLEERVNKLEKER